MQQSAALSYIQHQHLLISKLKGDTFSEYSVMFSIVYSTVPEAVQQENYQIQLYWTNFVVKTKNLLLL